MSDREWHIEMSNGGIIDIEGATEEEVNTFIYPVVERLYTRVRERISFDGLLIKVMDKDEFIIAVNAGDAIDEEVSPDGNQATWGVYQHDEERQDTDVILIRRDTPREEVQSNLAHEIGHFIYYHYIDWEKWKKFVGWDTDELLMPWNLMIKKLREADWLERPLTLSNQFTDTFEDFAESFRYLLGYTSDDGIDARFILMDDRREKFFRKHVFEKGKR